MGTPFPSVLVVHEKHSQEREFNEPDRVIDHDELRVDLVPATAVGKQEATGRIGVGSKTRGNDGGQEHAESDGVGLRKGR